VFYFIICYFSASHSEARVFYIRVVRMLFGLKGNEWGDFIMKSFTVCTPHQILFG